MQAGVNLGVTMGWTSPRPPSMARISSMERALAARPASGVASRYH